MTLSVLQQNELIQIADRLGKRLSANDFTIATAESCTGGGIAQAITAIAGSSAWFEGGIITYSNQMKHQLLAVSEDVLIEHGAVSQLVVEAMAHGVAEVCDSQVSVAVSGVAGPGGGSAEKPVGTVWIGWWINGQLFSECHRYDGDREMVRYQTIMDALAGVLDRL